MSGRLYVVGTPIGNLGDMTYRAVETLKSVDFIAAEDTRVSAKLLNYFGIKKPMVSYHEHNHKYSGESIIKRIVAGETCAVITDAGMPCISDPGEDLVRICRDRGLPVEAVPGPTAVATAAAVCGLSARRFTFEGFLSVSKKQRHEHLTGLARDSHAMIFYEAPHKLTATLSDMLNIFGDRRVSVCRELTKVHEQVMRTTLSHALDYYTENSPRGEFVLVVEGAGEEEKHEYSLDDAVKLAKKFIDEGMKPSLACREAAQVTGIRKNDIYTALL